MPRINAVYIFEPFTTVQGEYSKAIENFYAAQKAYQAAVTAYGNAQATYVNSIATTWMQFVNAYMIAIASGDYNEVVQAQTDFSNIMNGIQAAWDVAEAKWTEAITTWKAAQDALQKASERLKHTANQLTLYFKSTMKKGWMSVDTPLPWHR